jgi:hypothetical protein
LRSIQSPFFFLNPQNFFFFTYPTTFIKVGPHNFDPSLLGFDSSLLIHFSDLSLTLHWQMAGTKRQRESRISNLNKKKKMSAGSNVKFDMSGPAGAGPAVSVYDEM